MSFNPNHKISLSNYEEWLILYMDNELSAGQQAEVEQFLLLHPHLQEELDLLMDTRLPAENLVFAGKEELQAAAMKLNNMDEALLLYLDNELSPAEKKLVEERISADKNFSLEFALLQRTKANAADVVPYPNKKELYRHTERVVALFPIWMRVAVAVIVLLMAAFFMVNNGGKLATGDSYAVKTQPSVQPGKVTIPSKTIRETIAPQEPPALAKTETALKAEKRRTTTDAVTPQKNQPLPEVALAEQNVQTAAIQKADVIKIDITKQTNPTAAALNNPVASLAVTSLTLASYNLSDNPEEPIVTDGDDKQIRTPAKGFLRKVSRFIERRTGIGTVNADNELLVGAVALKLN